MKHREPICKNILFPAGSKCYCDDCQEMDFKNSDSNQVFLVPV
jgi:hypothetical protein